VTAPNLADSPEWIGLLAREGVTTAEELLRLRIALGMAPVAAILSIAEDLNAAGRAAERGVHAQALTVACPYCRAAPGDDCRYRRGRQAGLRLYPFLRHHASRLSASLDRLL
jgi:hypothetical protein